MRKINAIMLSSFGAIAVQPLVFLCWLGIPMLLSGETAALRDAVRYSFLPAVFAVPFVLFIGIPVTLVLVHYGNLRWWPLGMIGFVAAALPIALSGPGGGAGHSSGGNWHGKPVDFIVNGEPSLYGWLNYLESTCFFGLHGLVGATVFYVLWRHTMALTIHSSLTRFAGRLNSGVRPTYETCSAQLSNPASSSKRGGSSACLGDRSR